MGWRCIVDVCKTCFFSKMPTVFSFKLFLSISFEIPNWMIFVQLCIQNDPNFSNNILNLKDLKHPTSSKSETRKIPTAQPLHLIDGSVVTELALTHKGQPLLEEWPRRKVIDRTDHLYHINSSIHKNPPLLTRAVDYNVAKRAFRLGGVGNSKDCTFRCRKRVQEIFFCFWLLRVGAC